MLRQRCELNGDSDDDVLPGGIDAGQDAIRSRNSWYMDDILPGGGGQGPDVTSKTRIERRRTSWRYRGRIMRGQVTNSMMHGEHTSPRWKASKRGQSGRKV
jgi:hypothetical protein